MPSAVVPELVRPTWHWSPPRASSGGQEAIDLAASAGLALDPWQAWAVEEILGETEDGELAAFEAGICVPRQNGKGAVLEALALYWLFVEEVELILWSAHEFKTAAEAFRRMRILLQGAPDLWALVARITTANGDEAIELVTGQRLKFVARSKASGRGFTGDKIILDEAYDLDGDQIAALVPTLATVQDPQIIYTSSAGMSDSTVLREVRDRGRAGGDPSLCWMEWCATASGQDENGKDVYDLDDETQWQAANPGYRVRISKGFIGKERRTMSANPEKFGRERLGIWDEALAAAHPISPQAWAARAVAIDRPTGVPVFFVDVSPGSRSAAISAGYNRPGQLPYIELVDYRIGVDWLPERVKGIRARNRSAKWFCEATGAIKAELPALKKVGVIPTELATADMATGCTLIAKLAATGGMEHDDHPAYKAAIEAGVKRPIGDKQWVWGWKVSAGDICPIVTGTGAIWALSMRPVTTLFAAKA